LLLAVAAQASYPYYPYYSYARSALPYTPYAYSYSPYSPYTYSPYAYAAPAYTANQYHSQDELGQASFGYSHPGQAAVNYRDAFGNQVGSYAYINPDGKEVRVSYVADSNGFRVLSNDLPVAPAAPEVAAAVLPVPVQDTPEVAEAKIAHQKAVDAAIANDGVLPVVPAVPANDLEAPQPVEDTVEVREAKAAFFAAYAAAAAAAEAAGDEYIAPIIYLRVDIKASESNSLYNVDIKKIQQQVFVFSLINHKHYSLVRRRNHI
jgi:hypothetical protein